MAMSRAVREGPLPKPMMVYGMPFTSLVVLLVST
jgi:hypothetical protein